MATHSPGRRTRSAWQRHIALAAGLAAVTLACQERGGTDEPGGADTGARRATPYELAGHALVEELGCLACHVPAPARAAASIDAPALLGWQPTHDDDWLREHVQAPGAASGESIEMRELYEEELMSLVAWVVAVRQSDAAVLHASPAELAGGWVFFDYVCTECHAIAGAGGDRGPDLSQTGAKHPRAWLREQILYPEQHRADGEMPSFAGKITDDELEALLDYLTLLR